MYDDPPDYDVPPDELPDDACVLEGTVYPEHDYPSKHQGNECRRCGAEAEE